MTTYIIYNNQNTAKGCSYNAKTNKTKSTMYRWSYLVSIDRTQSCLILDKKADSIDEITGELVKTSCSYNDFLEFIKENAVFNNYTEVPKLDTNWDLEL